MDDEPKQQPLARSAVFRDLENLSKPELDPGSPISRINNIINEVENLEESEIYDPVALAKHCLDLYASAADEATKNIGYAHLNSGVRLRMMYQLGVITPDQMERIENKLETVELPAASLATQQTWYVSPRHAQRAMQVILAIGAFICSFFIERLIRKQQNLPEPEWWVANLASALWIFIIMFALFDRLGEGIKDRINWMVFRRTRTKALKQLIQLKQMCQAYFESFDELIPHFCLDD